MNIFKLLYITLGTISLGIAMLGFIIPGFPGTPFLLLTAALYMRGSKRMHNWLMANKYLGPYIRNFQRNRSVPLHIKIYATALMWVMVFISCYFFLDHPMVEIAIIASAALGSIVLLFFVKTSRGRPV
ncbi:MAG: YbaN family protein [Bacteroidales bacterium]